MVKKALIFAMLFICCTAYAAPQRIVSLKPNITELLFALGAGDSVVGVTTWCDRPEAAKKLPKVADYIQPNIEAIIALKPDLIVTSEENAIKRPVKALEEMGIATLILPFNSINDLIASAETLANATGHEKGGKRFIDGVKKAAAKSANAGEPRPRVLMIVGRRPLVAAGPGTYLGELIDIAGGDNIIDSGSAYPSVNMESVIAKAPDIIIDLSMGSEQNGLEFWKDLGLASAAKKRIYSLDISDFRIGPGIAKQIETLREITIK